MTRRQRGARTAQSRRRRRTMAAAVPLVGFVLLGLSAPWLTPCDPTANDLAATLQAPGGEHLLGTDQLGRDQLSRLLQAARISLTVTAAVLLLSIALGVVLGVTAGYVGRAFDRMLVGLVDVTMAAPALLVALAVIGVRGPGTENIVLALALTGWAPYARIARAQVRSARSGVHLDALRVLGAPRRRIVGRHLLPATIGPCLVYGSTDLGVIVLAVASLSFLGLGVPPPDAEWGAMLVEARPFLDSAWWLAYPPGIAITAVVLAANLLGENLTTGDRARPSAFFVGRRVPRRRPKSAGSSANAPVPAGPSVNAPVPAGPVSDHAESAEESAKSAQENAVFEVQALNVSYGDRRVVADVSLRLAAGEILALVGESGSGKSSSALGPLGLLGPSAQVSGSALLRTPADTLDLIGAPETALRQLYGREIGVVFQDSLAALNPLRTVGASLDQAIRLSGFATDRAEVRLRRASLLDAVGLPDAAPRYPHQLSGGMRQRVQLAIAVAGEPRLLIADEPTSALDVTVQADILGLLRRYRDRTGAAILLVTHDLGVVAEIADSVTVAYAGRIIEHGPAHRVLTRPDHPYTQGLLAAVPDLAVAPGTPFVTLPGAPGAGPDDVAGCSFGPRCRLVQPRCAAEVPELDLVGETHWSRCVRHPSAEVAVQPRPRGGARA
ncbi:dipeptide/oligopeptide/nickel ABC transporter permease/ATP-binding protein [Streptomyces spinoverrucosus]|uniref:dipeptide/oligopeptide/nickel ABC transporter permease/ATP-binding protein n=1 Tax=Streptomyces spinoverrucosus TaxID=284043 RepID=UPI0018C35D38|nr:dipeptide/oligopeptide/nickel ABC transporter permease/ATP-binding protein [Streptomyces spinoverrucosus]MBG0851598.1 dipeptide/oligopeptide/nickel ABC transporter permease/ATP-binding protein [Streptomyces spinoverrucosus]